MGRAVKLSSIQVLRALAALAVVIFHASGNVSTYGWNQSVVPFVARFGEAGVDVFFVISGFVMVITTAGREHGVSTALVFLRDRIIRVVPLYWLLTAAFVALLAVLPNTFGSARLSSWHAITSFLFVPSLNWAGVIAPVINVGWTLNYEIWFYLVFAIALTLKGRSWFTSTVLLAAAVLCSRVALHGSAGDFYGNTIVFEFSFGCFVGAAWLAGKRLGKFAACVSGTVALALMATMAPMLSEANRVIAVGIPAALLVSAFVSMEREVTWGTLMHRMGDASYSLYLTHVFAVPVSLKIIQRADSRHVLPGDLVTLLSVAASIIAAMGAYRLIERPIAGLLSRRRSIVAPQIG
ncbi:hypothetical protein WT09_17140 [Burkholderia stagnalis]|uniref:acyltransferase family protein n=1 Tax=Burkholderia stagnalis TaxID=1503054 RepID=UPI000757BA2E|nr:acyltransferase [Burkholderia stagnalis]KVL89530.1 hypothetical protein WT03_23005 [Burkholderia stagnalis]KVL98041.1 hypothetical protein WT02_12455 [Burkholderia stagnalis]KVM15795.1 hypothetical protein WT04_05465 [Burkholderia stagnalis]KVN13963.1 hypothetical protein WT09_17140 [Burkholderia stagnalis]